MTLPHSNSTENEANSVINTDNTDLTSDTDVSNRHGIYERFLSRINSIEGNDQNDKNSKYLEQLKSYEPYVRANNKKLNANTNNIAPDAIKVDALESQIIDNDEQGIASDDSLHNEQLNIEASTSTPVEPMNTLKTTLPKATDDIATNEVYKPVRNSKLLIIGALIGLASSAVIAVVLVATDIIPIGSQDQSIIAQNASINNTPMNTDSKEKSTEPVPLEASSVASKLASQETVPAQTADSAALDDSELNTAHNSVIAKSTAVGKTDEVINTDKTLTDDTISFEDFRAEAHNTLYRETD